MCLQALYFEGPNGLERRTADIPAELLEAAKAKRHELLEAVSNVDDELADVFLADQARRESYCSTATATHAFETHKILVRVSNQQYMFSKHCEYLASTPIVFPPHNSPHPALASRNRRWSC